MPNARLQTAVDRAKALQQYETLRRSNMIVKAVVITELRDGSFHVLGQNLTPNEIAPLLMIGADALTHAERNRRIVKLVSHVEPERRGEHNRAKPRVRAITKDADGVLVPPGGENFISCGECNHPAMRSRVSWSLTLPARREQRVSTSSERQDHGGLW
jgi:hypothetical protein